MKGYKTSKDYKRLKELLDKGWNVIIMYEVEGARLGDVVWKSSVARFTAGSSARFDSYELGPASMFRRNFKRFEANCKFWDFEFIEPTEE